MKFDKVNITTLPASQRASNYSGLHDAIKAMPFYTGAPDKEEGITVDCETEKEANNARNSVRSYAKSNKLLFTIKTEKLKEGEGFLIKKFEAEPPTASKPSSTSEPV